ncbi:MAG: hypothetical protein GY859_22360, partial [Desulfobacterales bacterium]|nr:hypothetical protein [Desulfobacterales bacterium]
MRNRKKLHFVLFAVMLLSVGCILTPGSVFGEDACLVGQSIPAFLASGVDPNLLLMIDNSASMRDLAYVKDQGCIDDGFSAAGDYMGYFEKDAIYYYDATDKRFEQAASIGAADGVEYKKDFIVDAAVVDQISVRVDETKTPPEVTAFYATGNILNWMTTSKQDVEKKILTGGKFESDELILEARGCLDRRFVKQLALEGDKTLTLGVRGPEAMIFDRWENAHEYAANDVVTDIEGNLWTTAAGGGSDGTGVADDDGVAWDEYWGTIWKAGEDYPVGSIVIDPSHQDAIYKGTLYIALEGGTASGTGVFDDRNGIGGTWDPHHLTHID